MTHIDLFSQNIIKNHVIVHPPKFYFALLVVIKNCFYFYFAKKNRPITSLHYHLTAEQRWNPPTIIFLTCRLKNNKNFTTPLTHITKTLHNINWDSCKREHHHHGHGYATTRVFRSRAESRVVWPRKARESLHLMQCRNRKEDSRSSPRVVRASLRLVIRRALAESPYQDTPTWMRP